jgi:pyroglutamyl-peptidase
MKVLVTAFEPFDGRNDNQSLQILKQIDLDHVDTFVLPVLFKDAFLKLKNHLNQHFYDLIIMLGEGPNTILHLEHVALNIMNARIPDANGHQPKSETIDEGPIGIHSTLPLAKFREVLEKDHLPFIDSYHAGTYVCNDLFYRVMRLDIPTLRGFIHVPNDPSYFETSFASIQSILQSLKKDT